MKIAPGHPRQVDRDPDLLDEGDSLTVSVTHQIRINGDDSWVKVESTTHVRPGETSDDTYNRVLQLVDSKAVLASEHVANTVIGTGK